MGLFFSKAWQKLFGKRDVRILLLGLDAAGKTTILYQLKLGEVVTTIPTIGFNVESIEYKKINFTMWDIGGQDNIRLLWRHYYQNSQGLIFVVDSTDKERLELAKEELQHMLAEDEMNNVVVLVLANKQDMPDAMSPSEVAEGLALPSLKGRKWHIHGCCAISGDGLHEGLDWLGNNISDK